MSRQKLVNYKHKQLISELNEFFIRLKIYHFMDNTGENIDKLKQNYSSISPNELDVILLKTVSALEEQNEPLIKY